jgi:OTU domain-containing protein 6
LAENFTPVDEEADEKLRRQAKDEERIIKRTCEELGVRIHEVNVFC